MKKTETIVKMIGTGLLAGAFLAGCGAQTGGETGTNTPAAEQTTVATEAATEAVTEVTATEAAPTEEVTESEAVGMANPWRSCTALEAKIACPRMFKAPDDAVVNGWMMMDVESDENGIPGPLIELDFRMDGVDFTARAQYGADMDADISGLYYDWIVTDDVTLANWGMGFMEGKVSRYIGDDGWTIDLCTWYDVEIGIAYSLSAEAADLDGFDIQAVAEQMYDVNNEPTIPDDEADGQNPVMNFIGQYYVGRGNLSISPEGTNGALIEVWWGSSAAEHSEWVMHGTFDESTMSINYSDCERHDITLKEDGTVESDVTAYTNGTGCVKINDDYTITWIDDQDHMADDLVMSN